MGKISVRDKSVFGKHKKRTGENHTHIYMYFPVKDFRSGFHSLLRRTVARGTTASLTLTYVHK